VGLLGRRERDVFARLAIFPGGATLEAAEAVCGADVDTLAVLVDDHLLFRADAVGEPRFGMLETVREYALELLGSERVDVEVALAEYFSKWADELRASATDEREWRGVVERLDPEVDNVRAALAAAAAWGDAEFQLRLAGPLWRYWWVRGPAGEGLEWIERVLAAGDGPATVARACALQGAAGLAWTRGDLARAKELARGAISVAVEAGSKWDEGSAHTVLGIVANTEGDRATARYHHERSLEISEELGIEPVVEKLNLGVVALDAGDYEAAIRLLEDVLESHRRHERAAGIGFALLSLGRARYEFGDQKAARRDIEEARACFEEVGFRGQVASALQGLAAVEASESRFEQAARLLGQARRLLDDAGQSGDEFGALAVSTEAQARAALGDEAFESAYAAGLDEPV
jgi:tetratricopeptide (TPR) repeat protein